MSIGLIGVKRGMTRVFTADGASIPVTVVEATPNRVTQRKTTDADGYEAIQVSCGAVPASRVSKPVAGHYAKASSEAGRGLWEFRLEGDENFNVGDELKVDRFSVGQKVDVTGQSKGKGYAGVVKRHNFSRQDMTHGNSVSHRAAGSTGQCQSPGKVFKGKRMAGQLGNVRVTVQTLEVVRVDEEKNLLLLKGAVPGATGADVIIRPSVKA